MQKEPISFSTYFQPSWKRLHYTYGILRLYVRTIAALNERQMIEKPCVFFKAMLFSYSS